jgi:hypothetical protein
VSFFEPKQSTCDTRSKQDCLKVNGYIDRLLDAFALTEILMWKNNFRVFYSALSRRWCVISFSICPVCFNISPHFTRVDKENLYIPALDYRHLSIVVVKIFIKIDQEKV